MDRLLDLVHRHENLQLILHQKHQNLGGFCTKSLRNATLSKPIFCAPATPRR